MKTALQEYFSQYSTADMAVKLANLSSTNSNENMNNMIARKAPKHVNYSESESLATRVAAATAQKNEGHSYILKVNQMHGLSPGRSTKKHTTTLDAIRTKKATQSTTADQKRRRIQLKEERSSVSYLREVEEGITYESGIVSISNELSDDAIEDIPSPPTSPVTLIDTNYTTEDVIVFDIETTGLGTDSSIIQLAAKHITTGDECNAYVRPTSGYIPNRITALTGLEYHVKRMYSRYEPVTCTNTTGVTRLLLLDK